MSITSVFASFESDYQTFINQMISSSPVDNHNAFSWMVSLDVTTKEGGDAHADIRVKGVTNTNADKVMWDLWVSLKIGKDIFPLAQSWDAKLDAVVWVITIGTGSGSSGYITLKQLDTNITMLLSTWLQTKIDTLKSWWFSMSGQIEQVAPTSTLASSIAQKAKIYKALLAYPLITPIKSKNTATNWVYNVKLDKSNMIRLVTRLAQINDPELSGTWLNQMRTTMIDSLKNYSSKWVFDPTKKSIQIVMMDTVTKSNTMIGLSTGSVTIKSTSKNLQWDDMKLKVDATWDRDSIDASLVGSNNDVSTTVLVKMNTYLDSTTQITAPATSRSLEAVLSQD